MSDSKVYDVLPHAAERALIDEATYQAMYKRSIEDPEGFWADMANEHVHWFRKWDKVADWTFDGDVGIRWFDGAKVNVAYNCLDRHLEERGDKPAILWEGDQPGEERSISFRALHAEVCRFANVLKSKGVRKGDRVCVYMPMVPEAAVAMLACARIGAVHSVVFGGFSPDALRDRILDSDCRVVVTADEGPRGGRNVPLKRNTHEALESCPNTHTCIVVRRTGNEVPWRDGRDVWYHEVMEDASPDCPAEELDAEDPLFILYTSGSTGMPKGVQHSQAGYLLYATLTFKYIFDYHEGDVFWCTADVGWVTGHSYVVYSPLSNGATTVMFEGVPNYPDFSRFWQICDKFGVNIFYTAPTAIRALMGQGDDFVKRTSRRERSNSRHRGRAHQPRSLGVVLPRGRRRPLPNRRHLVADRDRRCDDHPASGLHRAEARLGDPSAVRHRADPRRPRRQRARRRGGRRALHQAELARADADRVRRP